MKSIGLTAPLVVAGLIFISVWALGMLAVRSSVTATETSLELLRLHLQVAHLHEALATRSAVAADPHLDGLVEGPSTRRSASPPAAAAAPAPPEWPPSRWQRPNEEP